MGSIGVEDARRRCPGLVVLPMRVERYRQAGAEIHALLRRWGPVEKTSYDDFYADVTDVEGARAANAPASSASYPCSSSKCQIWRQRSTL